MNAATALLQPSHAQLIMLDPQENLLALMDGRDALERRLIDLAEAFGILKLPITVTLQNPEKLGPMASRIEYVLSSPRVFSKMAFSAWREKMIEAHLKNSTRRQIVVAGVETHVCVVQTVLDLIAQGFVVHVPFDAVASRKGHAHSDVSLSRMERAGAVITTTESVVFELCGAAGTETFRSLLHLAKT